MSDGGYEICCKESESDGVTIKKDEFKNAMMSLHMLMQGLSTQMDDGFKTTGEKIDKVNQDVESLKVRVGELEKQAFSSKPTPATTQTLFKEFSERDRRSRNIILYGLPEQQGDFVRVNDILKGIPSQPQAVKTFRIGRNQQPNKPRPVRVVFEKGEEAKAALRAREVWTKLKLQAKNDRTPMELDYLYNNKELRAELNRRIEEGASNLTLKYVNGWPTIVQKNA